MYMYKTSVTISYNALDLPTLTLTCKNYLLGSLALINNQDYHL